MKEQVVVVGRVWALTTKEENKEQGQHREDTSNSICKSKEPANRRLNKQIWGPNSSDYFMF
jgi:hypothetical protein